MDPFRRPPCTVNYPLTLQGLSNIYSPIIPRPSPSSPPDFTGLAFSMATETFFPPLFIPCPQWEILAILDSSWRRILVASNSVYVREDSCSISQMTRSDNGADRLIPKMGILCGQSVFDCWWCSFSNLFSFSRSLRFVCEPRMTAMPPTTYWSM